MKKKDTLFTSRSDFSCRHYPEDGVIAIIDLNGPKSVKDDIKNILSDLVTEIGIETLIKQKIMYKDNLGVWDGCKIIFQGGTIQHVLFFSIMETDFELAKQKLLTR